MRHCFAGDVQKWRLARAVAIVLALLCVAPGVDVALGMVGGADTGASPVSRFEASPYIDGDDPFGTLDRIDSALEVGEAVLPESFSEELHLLEGADDLRVDPTGMVVGYNVEGSEDEVLERIVSIMGDKGWTSVPLGRVTGSTFVKSEGRYTWALVTCTQVGDCTSVVTRCSAS